MVALLVLLLLLAIFGGLGFAAHVLWFVLIAALILWVIGYWSDGWKMPTGGNARSGQRLRGKRSRSHEWQLQTQKIGFGWYSTRSTRSPTASASTSSVRSS